VAGLGDVATTVRKGLGGTVRGNVMAIIGAGLGYVIVRALEKASKS
jgi:hypothetical protein